MTIFGIIWVEGVNPSKTNQFLPLFKKFMPLFWFLIFSFCHFFLSYSLCFHYFLPFLSFLIFTCFLFFFYIISLSCFPFRSLPIPSFFFSLFPLLFGFFFPPFHFHFCFPSLRLFVFWGKFAPIGYAPGVMLAIQRDQNSIQI